MRGELRRRGQVAERLASRPEVIALDPKTFGETMGDIRTIAQATRTRDAALDLVARQRARVDRVKIAVKGAPRRTVVAIEWFDPVFIAGHWTPQLIELRRRQRRARLRRRALRARPWEAVAAAQPEVVLVHPLRLRRRRARWRRPRVHATSCARSAPADVFALDAVRVLLPPRPAARRRPGDARPRAAPRPRARGARPRAPGQVVGLQRVVVDVAADGDRPDHRDDRQQRARRVAGPRLAHLVGLMEREPRERTADQAADVRRRSEMLERRHEAERQVDQRSAPPSPPLNGSTRARTARPRAAPIRPKTAPDAPTIDARRRRDSSAPNEPTSSAVK